MQEKACKPVVRKDNYHWWWAKKYLKLKRNQMSFWDKLLWGEKGKPNKQSGGAESANTHSKQNHLPSTRDVQKQLDSEDICKYNYGGRTGLQDEAIRFLFDEALPSLTQVNEETVSVEYRTEVPGPKEVKMRPAMTLAELEPMVFDKARSTIFRKASHHFIVNKCGGGVTLTIRCSSAYGEETWILLFWRSSKGFIAFL